MIFFCFSLLCSERILFLLIFMRFRIKTDIFRKAIDAASRAASTSNLSPILENIMIDAGYEEVTFTGNNLEMSIEYSVKEGVEVENPGRFTLSAKFLLSYVSLVQDPEITLDYEGGGSASIITNGGRTKLHGMDPEKFPSIPMIAEENPIILNAEDFRGAIDKTIFSAAEGNVRPMLAGIYMNATGEKLIFASTDSFRLSDYSLVPKNPISHQPIIIPKRTALELSHLMNTENIKEVEIFTQESQILIHIGAVKMTSRLLSGKFPEYNAFFPKEFQTKSTVLRTEFINALKQVDLVAQKNNHNIRIRSLSEGKIEIFTGDTDMGASNRTISGTVEGKDDTVGINSTYLLAVLNVIRDDYVSFEYKNPLSPIVIRGVATENSSTQEYRHLIMPLKI
ncbi:DNA polymerase III subunit beta [Candidatus Gracilibacteria bacterium GN02-873]|nr:DNA polymerase III subunit beta [Candidatus Gracilibacteria bacterium GN02-873]